MWKVIYVAPTIVIADKIRMRAEEEGFEIRIRPLSMGKQQQFEISVRETEVLEVQEFLMQILHQ